MVVVNHIQRIPGDYRFFICRDHLHFDVALRRADKRRIAGVGVELDAELGEARANHCAYCGCMFADTGGEHDAIQTTKRAGERADLPHHPEHKQFDGVMRASVATGEQGAHVAGDAAGYAEQPGTPIEQIRDLDGRPGGNPAA